MEVHTTQMVPSTSIGPSSLNSNPPCLVRVCSQCNCGSLIWPGLSKSDICDRCLARIGTHKGSTKTRDATRAYANTALCVESTSNDPRDRKEARSIAPTVPRSVAYSVVCDSILWA